MTKAQGFAVHTASNREDTSTYWATEADPHLFASRFRHRIDKYRNWLQYTGRANRMVRAWNCAWGWGVDGVGDTSQLRASGTQGELLDTTTNEFMTLVTQTAAMLLKDKPAGKAVARNADYSSLAQTKLADGLLQYYELEGHWAEYDAQSVLVALLLSESWQVDSWDTSLGEIEGFSPEGKPLRQGDIRTRVLTPFDVAYDPKTPDMRGLQWFAFRYRINRFDAAVRYPACAEELKSGRWSDSGQQTGWGAEREWELHQRDSSESRDEVSELAWAWELRVLPSDALPDGRLVQLVSPDCVLYDSLKPDGSGVKGGYPYKGRLHAYQMRAEGVPGGLAGYSHHFDLLSLQEATDNCVTAMVSAANAGGVQNMWVPSRSNVQVDALAGGLNIVESPVEPKPIDGVRVDPQVPALAAYLRETMIRRAGLNAVSVGETQKGMPAQLAALLEAQAIQYQSRLQASQHRAYCDSRTGRIYLLRDYATTTRVALVAGAAGSWAMKEWTGADLGAGPKGPGIERVTVEEQPAVMATLAGRMQVGEMMLSNNLIATREELLTLITTGQDKPLYEGDQANLMRLQKEKELLAQGIGLPPVAIGPNGQPLVGPDGGPVFQDPPVMPGQPPPTFIRPTISDTPWIDIKEYRAVIAAPEARNNPAVVKAATELISFKLRQWAQMPPQLQLLLGCPPQLVQGIPPPIPPPGAPPGKTPPPSAHAGGPPKPEAPGNSGDAGVKLPAPPQNPMTGEKPPAPEVG